MKILIGFVKRVVQLAGLAVDIKSKIIISVLYGFLYVINALGGKIKLKKGVKVALSYNGNQFEFFLFNILDFYILLEIFIGKEYKMQTDHSLQVIFDLGSNIGGTLVYFALENPEAKIYAFEPDQQNIEMINKNTKQFGQRIHLIEKAVYTNDGFIEFFPCTERHWSSSVIKRDGSSYAIKVPSITLDSAMAQFGVEVIDLIKFDIEGAEVEVFKNFNGLKNVRYLVGEVHPKLINMTVEQFLFFFPDFELLWRQDNNSSHSIVALKNKRFVGGASSAL